MTGWVVVVAVEEEAVVPGQDVQEVVAAVDVAAAVNSNLEHIGN